MIIGVPKEIKKAEYRVSTTPGGVGEYVAHGHTVLVERGAGLGSGFDDAAYERAGATLLATPEEVWALAALIVKVKEPVPAEFSRMRAGQLLFTYLHLAADGSLTRALVERGVTAIAYETVQLADGTLPLLTPMSEVAGRMAVQVGAHFLEATHGGGGCLLGGVPGVPPSSVVVLGGGVVGTNAAQIALGMGANVTILDKNVERLRTLDLSLHGRFQTVAANQAAIAAAVATADLVIGGILVTGARAPRVVTAAMVAAMRPGAVIVDVAIDQGGCVATSRPTTHADPIHLVDGVLHYGVTNMPGAVPRTSTFALANVTLPYGLALADLGLVGAVGQHPTLASGINVLAGQVVHPAVAEAFGLPAADLTAVLAAETAQRAVPAGVAAAALA